MNKNTLIKLILDVVKGKMPIDVICYEYGLSYDDVAPIFRSRKINKYYLIKLSANDRHKLYNEIAEEIINLRTKE